MLTTLLGVVAGLVAGHVLFTMMQPRIAGVSTYALSLFFDLGKEANLPAYFSALQLLVASGLVGVVWAATKKTGGKHVGAWLFLSLGVCLMSFDEAAQIHEGLVGTLMNEVVGTGTGVWRYTWYIPYIPLLGLLLVLYAPFLRDLPRRYLLLFGSAGVLFVGGAVGVEMIEAALTGIDGLPRDYLLLNQAVEEGAEMAAISLLIYALLCYIEDMGAVIDLRAGDAPRPQRPLRLVEADA